MATIYALCEPDTGAIRYIGSTAKTLGMRYSQHVCRADQGKTRKDEWISGLLDRGVKPAVLILDDDVTDHNRNEAERMYMSMALKAGADLLNMARPCVRGQLTVVK